MKILYALATLALAIMLHSAVDATDLEFSYPAAHEQWIDGFVVFENQDGEAVVVWRTPAKNQRRFTGIDLGSFGADCRGFFMAPFKAGKIGPYSDIYEVCPERDPPETYYIPADRVQGFIVRP